MTELLDIVGQDDAVAQLQGVLAGGRTPHAYLFVGPRGVGRRTTALAFARTLLCDEPQVRPNAGRLPALGDEAALRQACGRCESCRLAAAGSHADLHVVRKELARYHPDAAVRGRVMQTLGIDVVRDFLIAPAGRRSSRGRGKVFVVLEADQMGIEAQNCLLKTLEEPPEGVRLILVCRDAESLLPTTRSRCWLLRFGPLPAAFVEERLVAAGVAAGEAAFWAVFTGGSLGRALELAEAGVYEVREGLLEALAGVTSAGESALADYLTGAVDKLAGAAVAAAKARDGVDLSRTLATRRAAGVMLELLASVYRDALRLASGADGPRVHADRPDVPHRLAERFEPTDLAEIIDQCGRLEGLLWRNVNPKVIWDNVAVTCASAAPLRL